LQGHGNGDRQGRPPAEDYPHQAAQKQVSAGRSNPDMNERSDKERCGQQGNSGDFLIANAPGTVQGKEYRLAEPGQPPRRGQDAVGDMDRE